jgi:Family of unknown function (DUF6678)
MAGRAVQSRAADMWRRKTRETDRAVAAFAVRHMNETKWREVLAVLRAPESVIKRVRLKFIDSEHVIDSGGRFFLMPHACDGFPGPFEYREIEWLEVPERYIEKRGNAGTPAIERVQDVSRFREAVGRLGRLPITETKNGFRIVGYE